MVSRVLVGAGCVALFILATLPTASAQPPPETQYTAVITDAQDHPVGFNDLREIAFGEFVNETGGRALVFRITVTDWDATGTPSAAISVFFEFQNQAWRSTVASDGRPGPVGTPYGNSTFEDCLVEDESAYCWFGFDRLGLFQGATIGAPYAMSYAGAGDTEVVSGFGQDYAPGGLAVDAVGTGGTGDDYVIVTEKPSDAEGPADNVTENDTTKAPDPTSTAAPLEGGGSPGLGASRVLLGIAGAGILTRRRGPRTRR